MYRSWVKAERNSTRAVGQRAMIVRAASKDAIPGISMSRTTTFGLKRRAAVIASSALPTSATTVMVGLSCSTRATARRRRVWSSASRTLIESFMGVPVWAGVVDDVGRQSELSDGAAEVGQLEGFTQ